MSRAAAGCQQSCTFFNRKLTFQFLVVEDDTQIFKVFSVDKVQQVSSRSLIFPVEVFKVFAQDKAHLHHPHLLTLQLVFMEARTSLVKSFFALFPSRKKVRRSPRTRVRECFGAPAHPS